MSLSDSRLSDPRSATPQGFDVWAASDRYLIRVETVERSQVRIDAPGVPPRVIAELLLSTGAGRLHDYDEASLFEGWHESLLLEAPWSHPRPAVPGRIVAHARIHYDGDPRP